ncbi:membrane protein [Kineococcus radiotolerans]|uniref:Membrane protein n=1 Tax=Kineococcus radiotolerans TaxID=131568 RepID=A0A7W4XZ01_KINRA|nr:YhjD/YihY/BrkB family envelope integrity protein [Kineococcus radiotolerans]MBB2902790.1 membrane protein [Kineococcus radiotolerans]
MPGDPPRPRGGGRPGGDPEETMHEQPALVLPAPARVWRDVRALVAGTVGACVRFRVTGLAAEGGFFALLSLPPLVFGVVASLGYLGRWLGAEDVAAARGQLARITEAVFTSRAISDVILPTFDSVTTAGRADLTLLAFLVSVWSGSRALNVHVDTIAIMYGLGGHRGIVRTRLLSLSTYLVALLVGVVVVPLVLVGPRLLQEWLPEHLRVLSQLYWPVVLVLSVSCVTTLYHLATPVRSRWWRDVPGALLALLGWFVVSAVLRWSLSLSVAGPSTSIYGPLAAPIVVLVWFYFLAIAVLIGAALNSAVDRVWPDPGRAAAREAARVQAAERRRWVP